MSRGSRVRNLFNKVRAFASLRLPWLKQVDLHFCDLADRHHRERWRQFAHTGHLDVYTVCFSTAAEHELADEEVVGMAAHELGHVVGTVLEWPQHAQIAGNGGETPKAVQDEADKIARRVLGFRSLRYNRRTLQEAPGFFRAF